MCSYRPEKMCVKWSFFLIRMVVGRCLSVITKLQSPKITFFCLVKESGKISLLLNVVLFNYNTPQDGVKFFLLGWGLFESILIVILGGGGENLHSYLFIWRKKLFDLERTMYLAWF